MEFSKLSLPPKNSIYSSSCNTFSITTLNILSITPKSQSNISKNNSGISNDIKEKESIFKSEINQISKTLKSKESDLLVKNKIIEDYKKFVGNLKNETNYSNLRELIDNFTNSEESKNLKMFKIDEINSKFEDEQIKNGDESSNCLKSTQNKIKMIPNRSYESSKNMIQHFNQSINSKNREVKFQKEIMENEPAKLVDDSTIDYLLDKRFFEMDDINTELPKKIIHIMKILIKKIKALIKDEYGDYLLDLKSSSIELNEIREISSIIIQLLKTLLIQKDSNIDVYFI